MHHYNHDRPHRTLSLQSLVPHANPGQGPVVSTPVLGGLHHAYASGLNSDGLLPPHKFFSPLEKGERRAGLRRLDDLLLALEELNMREAGEIPTSLKEKLLREGVPVHGSSVSELIDVVLGSQQQFMLQERRTGKRRRRLTYVPTEDDLISVISSRYQG